MTSVNGRMDHLPSPVSDIATVITWAWTIVDRPAEDVAAAYHTTPERALRIRAIVVDLLFEIACGVRQ